MSAAHAQRPLHIVVAADRVGTIGRDGALPWRLPNDLRHFKRLTVGHAVLMGRRTWESLGRPLPERDNWVLSRDPGFEAPGARVFHAVEDALAVPGDGPLMVIGGAQLYRALLPRTQRIYLTRVDAQVEGDAHFPLQALDDFDEVSCETHPPDARHCHGYQFVRLDRRKPAQ